MGMMIHRNRKRKKERDLNRAELNHKEDSSFSDFETNDENEQNEGKYTKTDINRMTTAELQELAESEGIENANEKNGGDLKKILIQHFDL